MRIQLTNLENKKFYLNIDAIVSVIEGKPRGSIIHILGGQHGNNYGTCQESPDEVNRLCDEQEMRKEEDEYTKGSIRSTRTPRNS